MTEPTIIARLPKNKLEEVVVALTEFHDIDLVDIRVFAEMNGGTERRPTKKGIAIKVASLPALIAALKAAEVEAARRGLLNEWRTA